MSMMPVRAGVLPAALFLFGFLAACQPPPQSFAPPVRVTTHKRTRLVAARRTAVGICIVTRTGAPDTRYRDVCFRCHLTDLRQQCRDDNRVGRPGGPTDCGQCQWEETP
jgi:hypothetical protein